MTDPVLGPSESDHETTRRHGPGFAGEEEWLNAKIEESLPVYRLSINKTAEGLDTIASGLTDLKLVEFVVSTGNRPSTRWTLRQARDSYERAGFGGSGEDLRKGLATLPTRTGAKLVRLGQAEFLYLGHGKQKLMVYINKVPIPGIEPFKVYTAEEIRPHLQEFARSMRSGPDQAGGMGVTSFDDGGRSPGFPTSWTLTGGLATALGARSKGRKVSPSGPCSFAGRTLPCDAPWELVRLWAGGTGFPVSPGEAPAAAWTLRWQGLRG